MAASPSCAVHHFIGRHPLAGVATGNNKSRLSVWHLGKLQQLKCIVVAGVTGLRDALPYDEYATLTGGRGGLLLEAHMLS